MFTSIKKVCLLGMFVWVKIKKENTHETDKSSQDGSLFLMFSKRL
jgi:hypothetical protein